MIYRLLRPPLIVIGMHRSGTTMLSGLLHQSGIFMGNDQWGHNESRYFQSRNIKLMNENNSSWDATCANIIASAPEIDWFSFLRYYVGLKRKPKDFFQLLTQKPWGWKDPRNTITLQSWLKIFPLAKVLHVVRNGLDVAVSLYERNLQIPSDNQWHSAQLENINSCFDLWEKYVSCALSYESHLKNKMLTIRYELITQKDEDELQRMENFLNHSVSNTIKNESSILPQGGKFKSEKFTSLCNHAADSLLMKKLLYL